MSAERSLAAGRDPVNPSAGTIPLSTTDGDVTIDQCAACINRDGDLHADGCCDGDGHTDANGGAVVDAVPGVCPTDTPTPTSVIATSTPTPAVQPATVRVDSAVDQTGSRVSRSKSQSASMMP